jgi:type IV pilus assembly protein PilA
MLKRLRERAGSESGFTLVELLVVMLILGILAAIAIPSFFNQRNKATDAQAKAAARTAETAIETYATGNNGSYAGATPAGLAGIEPTLQTSGNNAITVTGVNNAGSPTATTYGVSSTAGTGDRFEIDRSGGTITFLCTPTGTNGCPTSGNWSS